MQPASAYRIAWHPGPPVAGLDTGMLGTELAGRTGMPSGRASLSELQAALGAYTGLDAASPRTAEIVGAVVAAITATVLAERPPSGGTAPLLHDGARQAPSGVRNGRPDVARLTLAGASALPVDGQMCAVFAVDIVGFTRPDRDDDIRRYLHERLYEYLQHAFNRSGVPWAECFCEDRGDGALIVIPPEIPVKCLIGPLPDTLRGLIRRHNHVSAAAADMQLRAAAHIGPVEHDGHGFVGSDVNFAFRMLDARPLKRMVAECGAELGLIVSEYVYSSLVCRYPSLVRPDAFRIIRFQAKNTRARAWTYLPGMER